MNIKELKLKLENIGFRKDFYSFNYNNSLDNCYCISEFKDYWEIYYVERGEKKLIVNFEYEFQACNYLLGVLINLMEQFYNLEIKVKARKN